MLDEIGEMSPKTQAKFLRVLEGHPFERVGGSEAIKVDVRVIAATNRDLEKDVAEGTFRRDLYFRLHVLEIIVPSLRKRPEDIPELAEYFLHRFVAETGSKIKGFTPRAMEELLRYRWPGNVRELKNVIERAVVLTRSEYIDHDDLVLSTLRTAGDTDSGILEAPTDAASRHRWPISRNSTFWTRSRRPAGTRAGQRLFLASSARRWIGRFGVMIWWKSGRITIEQFKLTSARAAGFTPAGMNPAARMAVEGLRRCLCTVSLPF